MACSCRYFFNALPLGRVSAFASVFDDCVLSHLTGTASDTTAKYVKEACVRESEQPAPQNIVALLQSSFPTVSFYKIGGTLYPSELGLIMTLNNQTLFDVTEITFAVVDLKSGSESDYRVQEFVPPEPPAGWLGPPDDVTKWMILGPGFTTFAVQISETPHPLSEATLQSGLFWKQYRVEIISAKGWPE